MSFFGSFRQMMNLTAPVRMFVLHHETVLSPVRSGLSITRWLENHSAVPSWLTLTASGSQLSMMAIYLLVAVLLLFFISDSLAASLELAGRVVGPSGRLLPPSSELLFQFSATCSASLFDLAVSLAGSGSQML